MCSQDDARFENRFDWVPYYKRIGRFGLPLLNKPDDREPLYWIAKDREDIFFVNNGDETLDYVMSSTGGMITSDEDVCSISGDGVFLKTLIQGKVSRLIRMTKFLIQTSYWQST